MLKTFDWEQAKKQHRDETYNYLRSVFNKNITEEQFAKEYSELPRINASTKTRSPKQARKQYRNLKKNFRFFELKEEKS